MFRITALSLAILLLFTGFLSQDQEGKCKVKTMVKGCKPNLESYKYDSYAFTELEFDSKEHKQEVVFTAFRGVKYRIVFCSSGFSEMVKLNIYDKNMRNKTRKKIYDNENGIDSRFWSFDPEKSGNYYIEYDVPPSSTGKNKKGCVIMLIGFKK